MLHERYSYLVSLQVQTVEARVRPTLRFALVRFSLLSLPFKSLISVEIAKEYDRFRVVVCIFGKRHGMLIAQQVGVFLPSVRTKASAVVFTSARTQIFVISITLKLVYGGFYLAARAASSPPVILSQSSYPSHSSITLTCVTQVVFVAHVTPYPHTKNARALCTVIFGGE